MSNHTHLRKPSEFRRVYAEGRRYDGRLMTAFVLPNGLSHHRFGITASRKATGKAVERNRSKRLLREAFRLSDLELEALKGRYDWVLNARRALLDVRAAAALEEFRQMVGRVAAHEESISVAS